MIEIDGVLYEKMSKKEFKKRLMKDLNIKEVKKKAGRKPEPVSEEAQHYYEHKKSQVPELSKTPSFKLTPKTIHSKHKVYK